MRSVLEESGNSVHSYTSPHLRRFNERIYLAGKEIDDGVLENLVNEARVLNENRAVTFFEITTALAFAAFSRTPADVLLLETGLGGRLDCTNVVEKPLACVITTVSYDHTDFLGESIEEIAAEKAGIIKPGVPVILGYQAIEQERIYKTVAAKAEECNAPLFVAGKDWECKGDGDVMRFSFGETEMLLPLPNLAGAHQIDNAGAALAALKVSGLLPEDSSVISSALQKIRWPARLQLINGGPIDDLIPSGWEVYVDGGHNDTAGMILANQINSWKEYDGRPVYAVIGMLKKKNPAPFLNSLLSVVDGAYAIRIPSASDECWQPEELEIPTLPGNTAREFLQNFFAVAHEPGRLLICGSIYLAGDVLEGYLS
jgi:dihydrofolate synthase/folylpolyglutamate synthase